MPGAHRSFVSRTRVYGQMRFMGMCEDCTWKGEARPERSDAEADAELHEALVDVRDEQRQAAREARAA
jgi:hypothetical protein